MDNGSRCQEHKNTPGRIGDSSPELVVQGEQSDRGDITIKQNTRCQLFTDESTEGCGAHLEKNNIRIMEKETSKNAYKYIQNESSLSSNRTLQRIAKSKIDPSTNRKHNNLGIYKSARRNKIMDIDAGNISTIQQDLQH